MSSPRMALLQQTTSQVFTISRVAEQVLLTSSRGNGAFMGSVQHVVKNLCNDPPVFAQVRLLFSMIGRFVPVFSCPRLDEAGVGYKTQSSH